MNITDLFKQPIADEKETELYKLFYNFRHDLKDSYKITIDYFKVVRVGNRYKLIDCSKCFNSDHKHKYIKRMFEYDKKEYVGEIKEFSNLAEIKRYIISLWHLDISDHTFDNYKDFDYMFNIDVYKAKIKNKILFVLNSVESTQITLDNFGRGVIDEINKELCRIAEVKKIEDNENLITYKYTKYKFIKLQGVQE